MADTRCFKSFILLLNPDRQTRLPPCLLNGIIPIGIEFGLRRTGRVDYSGGGNEPN